MTKKNKKVSTLHLRITDSKKKEVLKFCKKQKMTISRFLDYAIDYYILEYFKGEADD